MLAPKKDITADFAWTIANAMLLQYCFLKLLPSTDKYIDSVSDTQVLSTLDASRGYLQKVIDEFYRVWTAYTSQHGL